MKQKFTQLPAADVMSATAPVSICKTRIWMVPLAPVVMPKTAPIWQYRSSSVVSRSVAHHEISEAYCEIAARRLVAAFS